MRLAIFGDIHGNIEALRAALHHARGVRIDHVMGLFRLYWIPNGLTPDQGAYVAYPSEEMA